MSNTLSIILLKRSAEITEKIRDAKNLSEMSLLLSNAIREEVNKNKTYKISELCNARSRDIHDGHFIRYEIPGGIEGNHKLESLVAELVVAYMYPEPCPGVKKRLQRPSFAFLLGGLSALPPSDTRGKNFKQICLSAYCLALDLANVAMAAADADTLLDMARGIRAVQEGINPSQHSRHVVAALMAHRNLIDGGCAIPEKGQVRDAAGKILEEWRVPVCEDSARWREVYEAAGLKSLPQGRRGSRKKRQPSPRMA